MNPTPAKPSSTVAYVEGSGTACTGRIRPLRKSKTGQQLRLVGFETIVLKSQPIRITRRLDDVPYILFHSRNFPVEAALGTVLKFLSDESGATAIEYGLIAAGIALAIIAAVNGLGTNLNGVFTSVNNSLK